MAPRVRRRALLVAAGTVAAAGAGAGAVLMLRGQGEAPAPAGTPTLPPATTPVPIAGAGTPTAVVASGAADSFVAAAPRTLRAGQEALVSFALLSGDQPGRGRMAVSLRQGGRELAQTAGDIVGRQSLALAVPSLPAGDYELQVSGQGMTDKATVQIEEGTLVFVETDKPIYKPGQTIQIRLLTVDAGLRPQAASATVEVADAKGNKVFKKTTAVDATGMATLSLPLSTEPNLGVWKLTARVGQRLASRDVRVERYVLPKYDVRLQLDRTWALPTESIAGLVKADYTYGKPVSGEVVVSAFRFTGTWQEYARVTRSLNGSTTFEVPPVRYAAGTPASGGQAVVRLDVTVRETATGYEETTSQQVPIAASPVTVRLVPESVVFKPGLEFGLLVVAETPDKKPSDLDVTLTLVYRNEQLQSVLRETRSVRTQSGNALVRLTPPAAAVRLLVQPSAQGASGATIELFAGHAPSGAFIHVEQVTRGPIRVGDTVRFRVSATKEAKNLYYEVVGRGSVAYSAWSPTGDIAIVATPEMAPEARLLVYQLQPGSADVAADYVPFRVAATYEHQVDLAPDRPEVAPGDPVALRVTTQGEARVGLVAVDKAVYVLAENRLNLQQVFDELERLYQKPTIEVHLATGGNGSVPPPGPVAPGRPAEAEGPVAAVPAPSVPRVLPAAREIFQAAGLVVLSNRRIPDGKPLPMPVALPRAVAEAAKPAAGAAPPEAPAADTASLATVERVRQFFPETWLWATVTTDQAGAAEQRLTAPDSITTWMVRAVALSKARGLGVAETQVTVFQPFFVQVDLPYSAIRGEEFPVKVAIYNYLSTPQEVVVELAADAWFTALDAASRSVAVPANGVAAASFGIRPTGLGTRSVKVTARSQAVADALIKEIRIEPEGVPVETVENLVLSAGAGPRDLDLSLPPGIVSGSGRIVLAITGNMLGQTMAGLEGLLRMPFGCGEQNMLLFAPNVFITRYLKATSQVKPEVMARADLMMLTGYQRQLTYRRADASFSAFGQNDAQGSLWLTAFVLKTFAGARDLLHIDENVLAGASAWIVKVQRPDGSFEPVGFLHHQELLGGLKGKTALTAFVAIALQEAGAAAAAGRALGYLEQQVDSTPDAYGLALVAYVLGLAKRGRAAAARERLAALAKAVDGGLYWGDETQLIAPAPAARPGMVPQRPAMGAAIETTGYAALAFLVGGDVVRAQQAARWLASQRNALGGFGSTQDTVVALQALTAVSAAAQASIDATVRLVGVQTGPAQVRLAGETVDTLQVVDLPVAGQVRLEVTGTGQALAQVVKRFNVPAAAARAESVFQVEVSYGSQQIEVDDLITITVGVRYLPPRPVAAGMVVVDVAIPTGFAPEVTTLDVLARSLPRIKRWELAGRKVIFYIEEMQPNDVVMFSFKARALYPVKALAAVSQAYAYYTPEWRGESLGGGLVVKGRV